MILQNSKTKMLEEVGDGSAIFCYNRRCPIHRELASIPETAQRFLRMDNVAATIAMGVKDPTPAVSGDGAAIAPCPPRSTELVSDDFAVLHVATRSQAKSIYEQ